MSDRNAVQVAFDTFGHASGFTKRSGSWYRSSDEVIMVVNLQKSQYSTKYYVNVAFWLRALGDDQFPKEQRCHVRLRLERAAPEQQAELEQLLDLEREVLAEARRDRLLAVLHDSLDPVLREAVSVAGLRRLIDAGLFAAAAVTAPAQDLLGTTS
jgi:hypothetical protein